MGTSVAFLLPDCSVCLSRLNKDDNERNWVATPCGHLFHGGCLNTEGRNLRCPECDTEFDKNRLISMFYQPQPCATEEEPSKGLYSSVENALKLRQTHISKSLIQETRTESKLKRLLEEKLEPSLANLEEELHIIKDSISDFETNSAKMDSTFIDWKWRKRTTAVAVSATQYMEDASFQNLMQNLGALPPVSDKINPDWLSFWEKMRSCHDEFVNMKSESERLSNETKVARDKVAKASEESSILLGQVLELSNQVKRSSKKRKHDSKRKGDVSNSTSSRPSKLPLY